jgi:hypothetical protein
MTVMSESFVDLSYRGLALGKRIKLTQVRPQTGYLEMPTPMPVGTTIGIATDDGVLLEAVVAEVREQTGGSEGQPPGMVVKPNLSVEAQDRWWRSRIEVARDKDKAPPPADADGKVTLVSARMSGEGGVPELMDDGRDTGVMEAVSGADLVADPPDTLVADLPMVSPVAAAAPAERPSHDTLVVPMGEPMEEGPRTTAMDAVDLAALGLSISSDSLPTVKAEDYSDDSSGGTPEKSDGGGGKAKKKRKRR